MNISLVALLQRPVSSFNQWIFLVAFNSPFVTAYCSVGIKKCGVLIFLLLNELLLHMDPFISEFFLLYFPFCIMILLLIFVQK